jgi:PAS domain S-box-containing protein
MKRDLTERLEHPAYTSDVHARIATEAAGLGTWDWDIKNDRVYWNTVHFQLFGMAAQQESVRPALFFEHVHPEDKPWLSERLLRCRDTRETFEAEFRALLQDGTIKWMRGRGSVTGEQDGQATRMSGTMVDITREKEHELRLLESEARFRILGESLPLIVSLASPDGRIEYVSPYWTEFSGRSAEDFINSDWLSAVHPEDQMTMLEQWQTALATGQPYQYEFRARAKDGTYRWLLARGVPIRNEAAEVTRWINTALDIHDRKEAEKALRESEERKSFLLRLSDALHPLGDAVEIQGAVTSTAMNYFGADRCYYCEIEEDNAVIRRDASREGLPSVANVYPLGYLPILKAVIEAGRPFVVENVYTSTLVDEPLRQLCIDMQIISYLDVPVIKDGKAAGVLCITQSVPRAWTAFEVELATEVAERTWAAVERAKAEEALRKSEEKYRTLFDSIDEGFAIEELVYGADGEIEDIIFREVNQSYERQGGLTGVVGKSIKEVLPNLEQHWKDAFARVAKTGEPVRTVNYAQDVDRWFDVYMTMLAGSDKFVAIVFNDITERKRREREQEYLLKLADALRPLSDAVEIQRAATRILGEHVQVDRVQYADIDETRGDWVVVGSYLRGGAVPFSGEGRIEDFGSQSQEQRSGNTIAIADAATETKLTRSEREAFLAIEARAVLSVPLIKGGRWVATLSLHHSSPREWREEDIKLAQETAERTWASVERAKAEAELQKSEQRFRALVSKGGDMITVSDREGNITYASPTTEHVLGVTPEEFMRRHPFDSIHPEDRPRCEEALRQLVVTPGLSLELQHRVKHADGSWHWMEGTFTSLYHDPAVGGLVTNARDITGRKRAEEALRWFETIVASSQDAILSFDLEGRVLSWNPGAEEMFGYRAEEMIGASLSRLATADKESEQLELLEKLKRGERITQLETVRKRKAGETFAAMLTFSPIKNEQGEIIAATAIIQDITERKQTQEALHKSEEHFRLLVESATDYAIFTMDLSGVINSWNPGAERIFGYSEREIVGQPGATLFTPEDRAKGIPEQELQTALKEGSAADERYHLRKTGERFFASGVLTQLRDGNIEGFVKIARDLSERKRMEDALREADKRKDEFLAILAHELRNPLAPIRTSLEIMKRTKSQETTEEAKAVIERQTNQLVHLVDDLLDVSRISRGTIRLQKEHLELREVIELALESSRPQLEEKEHRLQVSLPFKKIELYGDKMRLSQVFLNLLNNAAKYTNPGGEIALTASLEPPNVVIRVRDTGLGIPPQKLSTLFELFTRLERDVSREGLGIGLSLVKRLVEMHGGSIEAYSAGEGQGSEFTVRLPVNGQGESKEQSRPTSKSQNQGEQKRRVLLIDDYEPNRKTIARLLKLMGHEVVTASGGEEGLERLTSFDPEVVLLDLNMPGMNGFEVAKRIREVPKLRQLKLIALTGYGQEQDKERTLQAGFDAHLVKPVDVAELEQLFKL